MHTQLFADLPEAKLRDYLKAIHVACDADAPRLALAAWLDELGDIRGRMIHGSLGLISGWSSAWESDILAFWLGTHFPRGVQWGSVRRGLLHIDVSGEYPSIDSSDESNTAFLAAVDQGWVGTAYVEASPAGVLRLPERTRSIVQAADSLHLVIRGEAHDSSFAGAGQLLNLESVSWEAIEGADCEVTDAGLAELDGLPRLKHLNIVGRFSPGALARFPRLECVPVNRATGE